ncbi:hypothetical protein [Streptomyces sp. NK15101]|uniref:hypothetical protein n=1 Tax=Streptomyces sp. NK15101 TaxID=2873261 RepID=UPI001CECEDA1|nr:hypothetical protein [Streptomyces sp. NK15101]
MSSKRSKNPALPVLDDAFRLASVKDAEESTRDLAARLATTELRLVSHPGRVTWEPTERAEPVPVPPTVVDGDGDLWLRDRGTGTWTMPEFNPKEFPARCGEVLTWNQLAREFGPLTGLADDRRIGGGRRRRPRSLRADRSVEQASGSPSGPAFAANSEAAWPARTVTMSAVPTGSRTSISLRTASSMRSLASSPWRNNPSRSARNIRTTATLSAFSWAWSWVRGLPVVCRMEAPL